MQSANLQYEMKGEEREREREAEVEEEREGRCEYTAFQVLLSSPEI